LPTASRFDERFRGESATEEANVFTLRYISTPPRPVCGAAERRSRHAGAAWELFGDGLYFFVFSGVTSAFAIAPSFGGFPYISTPMR